MIAPRKKSIIVAVAVLATLAGAMYFSHDSLAPKPVSHVGDATAVPVESALATRGDVDLSLNVVARTEAWSTVTVRARASGQLQALDFTPGAKVKKGDLLAQLDPLPFKAQLVQAQGSAASARAQLAQSQADLRRYSQVAAQGYISRTSFDAYRTNEEVARANLQTSQAAQELAKLQLGYTRMTAPFDGIVGLPSVWPGAQVTADSTDIVVLNQIEPIRISFNIPEASLAAVRAAQARGAVAVQARLPGENGLYLHGVLDFIDNTVDVNTSTIVLKGRFENADGRLTPGQFVQVSLPTVHLTKVVSVPAEALQSSDKGNFVFVIGADGKAHQRFVDMGATTEGRIVINQGLEANERVVTNGQLLLSDGSSVHTTPNV
jgi:multidrug efflux system membrane fusion protein